MFEPTPSAENIAVRQLDLALSLYLDRGDFICVITLAGAAEEILGRIARKENKKNSLDMDVDRKRELFLRLFPHDDCPSIKEFKDSDNLPRNMMKHLMDNSLESINLEQEAGRLLRRAIGNYEMLFERRTEKMRHFSSEWVKRTRKI